LVKSIKKAEMKEDIPLISIGFDGYNLTEALEGLSKTKSRNIVLCAIDGFTKHVIPEDMNTSEWEEVKELYKKYGLHFYGLAGHCNISDDSDMEKMIRRMEFVKFMGGIYIDTNAGHKGTENNFYKNIKKIINLAEKTDLTICLETHGDLIDSGKSGCRLLEKVDSDRIRIAYDPANVYFYSRGSINPISDIKYAMDYIGIIHFKGVYRNDDKSKWSFPVMEKSSFSYDDFFKVLEDYKYSGMIALEVEGRYSFEEGKGFSESPVWDQGIIINTYNSEIEYLNQKLFWM
jgi:sugar phosphate isomerase/epimerase